MRRLLFATYAGHANLTEDDRRLVAPLAQLGFSVTPLRWDEDAVPADSTGLVFRSCWNYDAKPEAFLRWLDELATRKIPCCNSVPLVRWNFHKRYLLDLAARGCSLPQTLLLPNGDRRTAAEVLAELGTIEAVVKPAVSMAARGTYRLSLSRLDESEASLASARERGELLVQRFVPEIQTEGETSLLFFGGEYSHAVRKRPAPGDFRSQTEHGGLHEPVAPSVAIRRQAEHVVACLDERPAIARVDGIEVGGELLLMEVELIDPSLFLGHHPEAVARCARVLADRL